MMFAHQRGECSGSRASSINSNAGWVRQCYWSLFIGLLLLNYAAGEVGYCRDQFVRSDRLCQVELESFLKRLNAVLAACVGRQGYCRCLTSAFRSRGTDLTDKVVAVLMRPSNIRNQ